MHRFRRRPQASGLFAQVRTQQLEPFGNLNFIYDGHKRSLILLDNLDSLFLRNSLVKIKLVHFAVLDMMKCYPVRSKQNQAFTNDHDPKKLPSSNWVCGHCGG